MDAEAERSFAEYAAARTPALLRFGLLLTGSPSDAEDLVQSALVKTYRAWRRVDDPDPFVRRVMVNTHRSWWRRSPLRREVVTGELPERAATDVFGDADLHATVWRALGSLPRGMRAVLVLRYYEGLTEAEIAAVLGCAVGTVKSQASRALEKLRAQADLRSEFAPVGEAS